MRTDELTNELATKRSKHTNHTHTHTHIYTHTQHTYTHTHAHRQRDINRSAVCFFTYCPTSTSRALVVHFSPLRYNSFPIIRRDGAAVIPVDNIDYIGAVARHFGAFVNFIGDERALTPDSPDQRAGPAGAADGSRPSVRSSVRLLHRPAGRPAGRPRRSVRQVCDCTGGGVLISTDSDCIRPTDVLR